MIDRKQNLLVIGPTGVGKSWIACALGHKACRDNRSVAYHRVPRLLEALALARGDGRYGRLLKALGRVQLLILDDWGLAPLTSEQRRDLLESVRIASPEMFPSDERLPHLMCSRAGLRAGTGDGTFEHDDA